MIKEEDLLPYNPVQAIIVYCKKANTDYYLETHDIIERDGKFAWQEGRPFLKEQLQALALSLKETTFRPMEINGIIPENLLNIKQGFSDTTIVWYLPPSEKMLHFDSALKIDSGVCKLPGLIFAQNGNAFYAVAYKGNMKPHINTPLFKAPFFNMYEDASVCMGNVKETKQKFVLLHEIERLENRFFNSKFSHFLDEAVVDKTVNLSLLFKKIITYKEKFPEDALVPSVYKTLNEFLKKVVNESD